MDYEQDYIMRLVKDMARMIAKMLLGRKTPEYVLPEEEEEYSSLDSLYRKWERMADDPGTASEPDQSGQLCRQ